MVRKISMMKIKPIKIMPINFHLGLDTDKDNVIDWRDCRPFDRKKHTISKMKKEQLREAPIFLTDMPLEISKKGYLSFDEDLYEPYEKKGKKHAGYASSVLRSLQKNYPGLIRELAQIGVDEIRIHGYPSESKAKVYPLGFAAIDGNEIIVTPSPYIDPLSKKAVDRYAHDLFHELMHIRQIKEGRIGDTITSQEYVTRDNKKVREKYKQSKAEQEAEAYAEKKMKEYKQKGKKPSGRRITDVLELD